MRRRDFFRYLDPDRDVIVVTAHIQIGFQAGHLVLKLSHVVLLASHREQRGREASSRCAASERNFISEVELQNARYEVAASSSQAEQV
jgi:hypothetical protein